MVKFPNAVALNTTAPKLVPDHQAQSKPGQAIFRVLSCRGSRFARIYLAKLLTTLHKRTTCIDTWYESLVASAKLPPELCFDDCL